MKMTSDQMTNAFYRKAKIDTRNMTRSDEKAFQKIKADPDYTDVKANILKQVFGG